MEQVSDGGSVQELVGNFLLGDANCGIIALDGDRGQTSLVDGLEGILDLVKATFRRKDSDVAIEPRAATARHPR
jgi:hypothetical protein